MGPLGLRGSLLLGSLVLDFDHHTHCGLYLVDGVGGWVGGRITRNKIVSKIDCFYFFFLNVFNYQGERFKKNTTNKQKIELLDQKLTQKSKLLVKLTSMFWQFWGSKKSFYDFFKVF